MTAQHAHSSAKPLRNPSPVRSAVPSAAAPSFLRWRLRLLRSYVLHYLRSSAEHRSSYPALLRISYVVSLLGALGVIVSVMLR